MKSVHFEVQVSTTDSESSHSSGDDDFPLEYEIEQRRRDEARRLTSLRNAYVEWMCTALLEFDGETLPGFVEWCTYMKGVRRHEMKSFASELWLNHM